MEKTMIRKLSLGLITVLTPLVLAACGSPAANTAPTVPVAATSAAAPTTAPAANNDQIVLNLASDGNEARYRVREQLANVNLPSDAIGKTSAVTGTIIVNSDGTVDSTQSKITVDITGLQSDSSMRDGFIQNSVFQSSQFPNVEFVPTKITGLANPLPQSGALTFKLEGNLTVHGTTKPVTWDATATATDGKDLKGTATTSFTFADFGLNQPHVPRVLSIQDTIKLEYDFHFVKAN
jgi:polyisoprenoid-binding protein YceI